MSIVLRIALALCLLVFPTGIGAMAQEPAFRQLHLYGGGAGIYSIGPAARIAVSGNRGIYRLTGDDTRWSRIPPSSLENQFVRKIVSTSDGQLALAGTTSGLHRSTDLGLTWTKDTSTMASKFAYAMLMTPDGALLLTVVDEPPARPVYRSLDSGRTWVKIVDNVVRSNEPVAMIDDTTLLMATTYRQGTTIRTKVHRSNDTGNSWHVVLDTAFTDATVTLLADAHSAFVAHHRGLLASADRGGSWSSLRHPDSTSSFADLFLHDERLFVSLANGSVHITENVGATWSKLSDGFDAEPIHLYVLEGDEAVGSTPSVIVRSTNGGVTWQEHVSGLTTFSLHSVTVGPGGTFHAATEGVLYSSDDEGVTWQRQGRGTLEALSRIRAVRPLFNGEIAVAGDQGVYFANADRTTWRHHMAGMTPTGWERGVVGVTEREGGGIYIGTGSGVFRFTDDSVWVAEGLQGFTIPALAVTADGSMYASASDLAFKGVWRMVGGSFEWKKFEDGLTDLNARDFELTRDSTVFLASSSGFYRTRPGVERWTRLDSGITGADFRSISTHASGAVAASTPGEILFSPDGTEWRALGGNIPTGIHSITFDHAGRLLIATEGNGLWISADRVASATDDVAAHREASFSARIRDGYSDDAVILTITSGIADRFRVRVVDLLGSQRLPAVDAAITSRGAHDVHLDVGSLPSGTYFYECGSSQGTVVGRFVVAR